MQRQFANFGSEFDLVDVLVVVDPCQSGGTSMKMAIVALAGVLLAGMYGAQPAQAQWDRGYSTQTAPEQRYERRGDDRRGEPGYGSEMRERCAGLHRESESIRARMDREWNPLERSRMEGRLREVRQQEERDRCR
jgi:hypothetical protein